MTQQGHTSRYISKLIFSLLLSLCILPASSQSKKLSVEEPDTIAWLHGFAVSVDLAGMVQKAVSDYGQYEAALRINLKDKYFPIVEAGIGKASHDDDVTQINYTSNAPYFRVGLDMNLMKIKHDVNRIYGGMRYAFSSFKYDITHPGVTDPVWGGSAGYEGKDIKCNWHWLELVGGIDTKIWGPIHLGWSARYRMRLSHKDGSMGNVWYVPGYGKAGSSRLGGTFNLSIDI